MGTLSKAFGCFGGFVAGSKDLITFLTSSARSFMYSTSLPPAIAEACVRAIDIVDTHSLHLRKKLWKNRERLYRGFESLGFDTLGSETPVPEGMCRTRFSVTAAHTEEEIDYVSWKN
jgi:7-keto-8-aminopelargonate synthetase-like enzyme